MDNEEVNNQNDSEAEPEPEEEEDLNEEEEEEEDEIVGDVEDDAVDDVVVGDDEDDLEEDEEDEEDEASKAILPTSYTTDENSDTDSDEEDSDDESEDGDTFYTRIDNETKQKFIEAIHPEELQETEHDMNAASIILRNDLGDVLDERHQTYPFLTKYERAKILGLRITQLNKGAIPLIEYQSNIIDNHLIAERELKEKQIPFIIMRPLPNGKKEYWRLQDLEIIDR